MFYEYLTAPSVSFALPLEFVGFHLHEWGAGGSFPMHQTVEFHKNTYVLLNIIVENNEIFDTERELHSNSV